jgi:transposase
VRIVAETGKPVAQVARDLGISAYTLHNWVTADRRQVGQSGDGPLSDSERDELIRLRAERAQWERLSRRAAPTNPADRVTVPPTFAAVGRLRSPQ